MVAPTTGKLKAIIDEVAVQLDTVDNLYVFKYPEPDPKLFPCAIIRDAPIRSADYRATSPQAVYYFEIMVFAKEFDPQAAFEYLEKFMSADSPSSVKSLMNNVVVAGVQIVEIMYTTRRELYSIGRTHRWGVGFLCTGRVT